MIIKKAEIARFRGFENVEIELGSQLTIIAGQNGTQKTTILGMLSQPFTINDPSNPMKDEKPLCGGSFKSAFSEKFKMSDTFDIAKGHEWTLYIFNEVPFTVQSIKRGNDKIRFWKKGDRSKGSGYIQLPVVFLSLKRLMPIGEDLRLDESSLQSLTSLEEQLFKSWHQKILISTEEITTANYLESPDKNTLGVNTAYYDWRQNSSGQDNVGKILLAVLSFKRLKDKYPSTYRGGILAIDELDATLYPGSQIKLIEALRKFSSDYKIQVIFTTHSLTILEKTCELQELNKANDATKEQIKVVFLEKKNHKIKIVQNATIDTIRHRLNVTIESRKKLKIDAFTEDRECIVFAKALLKRKASMFNFVDCTLSCSSLIDLATRKIPSFVLPNSIIFLDGDVKEQKSDYKKVKGLDNVVLLPTNISPERVLATFLNELDDESPVWDNININFTKQYCFKDYTLKDILNDRVKAKKWFNEHLKDWGINANKIVNPWIKENNALTEQFIADFIEVYNKFATKLAIEKMTT
ncbi:putative ABC oligo/dipeptide transport, ATP-binding protein [Arcticibacter svalbardensis MN12-7]|uniref:Putative ABC oligo/dipeptide transport, ATP-binding protein n=1 Tax=Arcticibacter svalbardensis MN12-7 TaxID=1150600 RepID=R9H2C7_9SPHI|nr:AAA family ATPase [Arcticibacter svalbardensis]EOR95374.1 putative ABC oligo/dipeptide transport, ATP-binding protein [Arcticibacter svalbardensis MN12-7]